MASSAISASSAPENTLPVGFIGLFITSSLVFGPKAARSSASGSDHWSIGDWGGLSLTMRGTAPASWTMGR